MLTFDQPAGLNGSCVIAPGVILLADSLAGVIWRVDLAEDGLSATASVWPKDPTMAPNPDNGVTSVMGPQPGINGIRYAARTHVVYYTATARKLFMRVAVDQHYAPIGEPEVVVADITADDLCLDEDAEVAYLTTHTDNTIVAVPVGSRRGAPASWPGSRSPNSSSDRPAQRGRWPGDYGRAAYVTTDGGLTAAEYRRPGADKTVRPARVLRVRF